MMKTNTEPVFQKDQSVGSGFQSYTISRLSKIPLHHQLYEILRTRILSGEWKPGQLFPTEIELITEFNVSRATLRQVLDRLVNEGLIYRQQGRGTYVSESKLEQGLSRIVSFTDDMKRRGMLPGTRVLKFHSIHANTEVAKNLKVNPGTQVIETERLRLANDEPICIEESYLIHALCKGLLDCDPETQPLRFLLREKFGVKINRAYQTIQARVADPRRAELLCINPDSPILYIERVSFSEMEIPVEFLRLYFRGDRYILHNELKD